MTLGSFPDYNSPVLRPFHYSFLVRDLVSTRRFYGDILGCAEGRSTEHWVDFDFFGNQISAHVSDRVTEPEPLGKVDDRTVPMPHFGAVLEWAEFATLAERIRASKVTFVIKPYVRFEGAPGEQATMFMYDFSGNALEFKAFRNPEQIFTPVP